mmetsp:Transcript_21239/g.25276  ORF Transcript_21239/g.25276 Transcript_21239/m.25276 type:complete len:86 (+) Transcript_21239:108-365(+)
MMVTLRRGIQLILTASIATTPSSSLAFSPPTTVSSNSQAFDALNETPLVRASDGQTLNVPSLWRSNGPFGIGDEIAVVAMIRHFG